MLSEETMTDHFEDDTLRRRFNELRREESESAPNFDDVLTRALARPRAPARSSVRILAAAAAFVLALGSDGSHCVRAAVLRHSTT